VQAAWRGNEPGIPFSTTITVGWRENATVAKHAVLIMHRTDIRTHRDGWVVVERHKDTTHTTPLLTLHTLTSHVVCHRILVFATMRAAPRR